VSSSTACEGHQAGTEDPLKQAEQHYLIQALGRAAQHGGNGKARHRPHEQPLRPILAEMKPVSGMKMAAATM
jgi:hypothetical protein